MKHLVLAVLMGIASFQAIGQATYLPLNGYGYHQVDRLDIKYGKVLPIPHTALKPFNRVLLADYAEAMHHSNLVRTPADRFNTDYLLDESTPWLDSTDRSRTPLWKIFYPERANMFAVSAKDFELRINPVVQLNMGYEGGEDGDLLFTNTRGVELRASIKKRISFHAFVGENQVRFPSYVRQQTHLSRYEHVNGEGYFKRYRETGVDYFAARGSVTFNLLDHIDFQFGYDKNFIGNGFRSLYLSDNANAYLFLKMNTRVWRINYQNLYTQFVQQYDRGGDRLLPKKYGAFHHLNVNVTHFLDIGLFEGVIFSRDDHFELHYLNPIIFFRSIEQDLGSPDNAFVGLDYKANIARRISLYGQFVFDEFNFEQIRARNGWWANKFGIQQGIKYIDVAGIPNLDAQLEFNMVRPFMYSHASNQGSQGANHTHYNQPLAHPLGANFREVVGVVRYQPQFLPEMMVTLTYNHAYVGRDTMGSNWGSNIFLPTREATAQMPFGNEVGQGVTHRIHSLHTLIQYQPWHNVFVDLDVGLRRVNSDLDGQDDTDVWLGGGVRLNMPYRAYRF